jgi:hypothetical protein
MRVYIRIAVAREVFTRRDHSVILKAMDESDAEPGIELGVFAVRTSVDDRIVGIVVYVQDWGIRDMNPKGSPFYGCKATHLVRQRCIAGGANRHLRGKKDGATEVYCVWYEVSAARTKAGTRLQVSADQEWNGAHGLHRVQL